MRDGVMKRLQLGLGPYLGDIFGHRHTWAIFLVIAIGHRGHARCELRRTPLRRSPTSENLPSETVRKVPEVPEMEPHETSQRHHSARSLPGMMARPTLGGLLEPLFGQFQKEYSRKFACRILHRTPPDGREDGFCGRSRAASEDYMLRWCIKIRRRE